jgi:hypothetical protein
MSREKTGRVGFALLVTLFVVAIVAPVNASLVATGPKVASDHLGDCVWTSRLNPEPALRMETCPWLSNALDAQGWNADNGWDITYGAALEGTLDVITYYAWVTTAPTDTIGGLTYGGGGPHTCWGGAHFRAEYTPMGNDPTDIHWIQVISTNCATDFGSGNGYNAGGGYWEYLDNSETPNANPFYDNDPPDPATDTEFLDIPTRPCPDSTCPCAGVCDWDAQVFVATWDERDKSMTIYEDGIWWGFTMTCVPEPATLVVFCGIFAFGWVACFWHAPRRRRA